MTVPAEDPARNDEPSAPPDGPTPGGRTVTVLAVVTALGAIVTPIAVAIIEKF